MAATPSSVPSNFFIGFRRPHSPNEIPAISLSPHQTPPKLQASAITSKKNEVHRLESGVGGLQVKHGLQKVFASGGSPPPNLSADKGKVNSIGSSVADGPPLPTILAGIVVFLLFFWVLGSIIMWIVGLIVNAPSS